MIAEALPTAYVPELVASYLEPSLYAELGIAAGDLHANLADRRDRSGLCPPRPHLVESIRDAFTGWSSWEFSGHEVQMYCANPRIASTIGSYMGKVLARIGVSPTTVDGRWVIIHSDDLPAVRAKLPTLVQDCPVDRPRRRLIKRLQSGGPAPQNAGPS
jgi:hypothetical protein